MKLVGFNQDLSQVFEDIPAISPMLASALPEPFEDINWSFEIKWDGYRCLLYLKGQDMLLRSRNGVLLNERFTGLLQIPKMLCQNEAKSLIVDGEIVAFDGKIPRFSKLVSNPKSAVYIAFDLLYLNGETLFHLPLYRRKDKLGKLFSWEAPIYFSKDYSESGSALFALAQKLNLEGIMAKKKDSLYSPGKLTKNWVKIKNDREDRFWIVGYIPSPGRQIGVLVLAAEKNSESNKTTKDLLLVGKVAATLDLESEKSLLRKFGSAKDNKPPYVSGRLAKRQGQLIRWIEPYFGALVRYTEITPDGNLRHPVFRRLVEV